MFRPSTAKSIKSQVPENLFIIFATLITVLASVILGSVEKFEPLKMFLGVIMLIVFPLSLGYTAIKFLLKKKIKTLESISFSLITSILLAIAFRKEILQYSRFSSIQISLTFLGILCGLFIIIVLLFILFNGLISYLKKTRLENIGTSRLRELKTKINKIIKIFTRSRVFLVAIIFLILGGFTIDYIVFERVYFVLSLLIIYSVLVIAVGILGRGCLKGKKDQELELYATRVNYLLALSGISLTVLIFLMSPIGIISEKTIPVAYKSTVAFFIASFLIFLITCKLADFEIHNLVAYLVEGLTDIGLLALASGFVLLVSESIPSLQWCFLGLFIFFLLIIYNNYSWYKFMKIRKEVLD
jgi:hypothetical protein